MRTSESIPARDARDSADMLRRKAIYKELSFVRSAVRSGALVAAALAALGLFCEPVRADESTIPLSKLEERVSNSFWLQAAERHEEETAQFTQVEVAKSGLSYFSETNLGPFSHIVNNEFNYQALRYGLQIGVQKPLLGTEFSQNQSILSAQVEAELAKITYEEDRRQVLAQLRESYVQYWQFDQEAAIAQNYLDVVSNMLPSARALRRIGFWTQGNFLDFLVSVSGARSQVQTSLSSRRAQLARISSVLGEDLQSFRPLPPLFADDCAPRSEDALASALEVDSTIAKLEAQIAETKALLKQVSGSSVEASAHAFVGGVVDYPPRSGYDAAVGVTVSLPTHARSEEHARRNEFESQLANLQLLEQQRRVDVTAAVEQALDEYANAKLVLEQALADERARREGLREARVRFATVNAPGTTAFNEVQSDAAEVFTSARASAEARATLLLKANQLLLLAPAACTAPNRSTPTPLPMPSGTATPSARASN